MYVSYGLLVLGSCFENDAACRFMCGVEDCPSGSIVRQGSWFSPVTMQELCVLLFRLSHSVCSNMIETC